VQTSGIFYTVPLGIMFFCWIGCMFGELDNPLTSYIGWTIYMFFVAELTFIRCKAREAYNVYGFWLEDLFACMVMWPYVASQLSLQVLTQLAPRAYAGRRMSVHVSASAVCACRCCWTL
jgi:hypothetical protein